MGTCRGEHFHCLEKGLIKDVRRMNAQSGVDIFNAVKGLHENYVGESVWEEQNSILVGKAVISLRFECKFFICSASKAHTKNGSRGIF